MVASTKEEFWIELDAIGEELVRERVVTKKYGKAGDKLALAEEWLRIKEQERKDAIVQEHLDIARSAGRHATTANWIALGALLLSALAFVFSLMPG